ncbi:Nodal modulator 1 [Halotydeus destructor]|nr:Nodal modulator 1 [Halotydeus destructor]
MDKAWTDGALDKLGQFLAKKLAGVSVKVLGEDKKPLRDVLISLSGGSDNYRRNLVTPASGGLTFVGLSPGHYYLKSMMKEYAFEPSSKMIEVREGQTEDVDIVGKRTAFSVFGSIASLSGEPEAGAVIEAIPDRLDGQGDCSKLHAEEAVADEQGSFRIRGLKPKCFYYVRIKTNDDRNVVISRTVPAEEKVQVTDDDVRNVQLIAFRKATHMDITGDVLTSHYEHLNSVKINLYILGTEQLVSSNQLSSVSAFFTMPSIPLDSSRTYVLRLETTLARTLYDFTVQEISFQANKSYDHFQFEFYPKLKMGTGSSLGDSSIEADGTYGGNVYTLPLFLLIGLIFYNWAQLQPYVQTAYESAQSLVARSQSGQGSRGSSPETELRNKKNKVKRT